MRIDLVLPRVIRPRCRKEFAAAKCHYEEAIKLADPDLTQLPDAFFSLSVLTMLTVQPGDDQLAALARASRQFKSGCEAGKRLRRWMPSKVGYEATQRLARGLLPKFAKACTEEPEPTKEERRKGKKDE